MISQIHKLMNELMNESCDARQTIDTRVQIINHYRWSSTKIGHCDTRSLPGMDH